MLGNEVMSKEQLYDLYQQILGVKKFEHQLLYNEMQVHHLCADVRTFCLLEFVGTSHTTVPCSSLRFPAWKWLVFGLVFAHPPLQDNRKSYK